MQITTLRLKNFQSFGSRPTEIDITDLTFILGPNGTGKTAVLEALTRLFSPIAAQRSIRLTDFHVPLNTANAAVSSAANELWIEVEIVLPESGEVGQHASVPPCFTHMRIRSETDVPSICIRLTANMNEFGEIDERIEYVLEIDENGEPVDVKTMNRYDRSYIEVHYLPARRNPADHVSYAASSLIGRIFRAADWGSESEQLSTLSKQISKILASNAAVESLNTSIASQWQGVYTGQFFRDPAVTFGHGELDSLLRQLTINFSPSHNVDALSFKRLSDGQSSLLYISLVLAWHELSQRALTGEETGLDLDKLRPPVHTIFAVEEPENSLAPQYLGRLIRQLRQACEYGDAQALIATHAPALLRRTDPNDIRFLRLNVARETTIHRINIPENDQEAAKYVQAAVMAYPELYFSRLVVLGEGASELVVMPRILAAAGIAEDDSSVSVVPLGGRHVNHFWKLLNDLQIPYVTLLDLDSARFGGGWGRVRNVLQQIDKFKQSCDSSYINNLPKWDDESRIPEIHDASFLLELEEKHGVYFSHPVDLDLMMMKAFPGEYEVQLRCPEKGTIEAVLGKKHGSQNLLDEDVLKLFEDYRDKFGRKSKPASHLAALSQLDNKGLLERLPPQLCRLINAVRDQLAELPE